MLNNIYNFIYLLGLQTIRRLKKFGKRMKEVVLRPLRAVTTLIFTALIVIDKFALKTFHEITADVKSLLGNTKRVLSEAKSDGTVTRRDRLKRMPSYFPKMWRLYKRVFVYAGNIVLPIISFIIMLNVIFACTDRTFALELTYNGEVIGFVKSEAVYKEARNQALERLQIKSGDVTADDVRQELIGNAEYSLKAVKLSQINDAEAICDSLIANSNCRITSACGVYVDDKFLCAVKNETDALAVFDNILSEYEDDDNDSAVSFVEEINYVQGLYPDNENTVWDAKRLSDKLATKKSEARYYTVKAGDTVSQIAEACSVSTAEIFALNPEIQNSIYVGQKILVEKDVNFVQVQITKTETHTETIKYSTVKVNTDTLYVGDSKTVVKGQNGEQTVTELVTYIDGVRVSSKEVSRVTVKEAVDEKIQVGTKRNNFYGSGGYYNFSYSGAKFCWPGVGATIISSRYGKRALNGWHNGIDLCRPGGSMGAPVVAAESGKVVYTGYESMGGYVIRIDHGNGLSTLYAHLKPGSTCVRTGQYVTRGQQIAQIGDTGFVTGPHLHFEVRVNGNRVDPAPYLGIR